MKFYRDVNTDICYELSYFKDNFKDNLENGEVLKLELQKRERKPIYFWCKKEFDFVEKGCNTDCKEYIPCNGKSGRCRHYKTPFEGTNIYFELSKSGLKQCRN